MWSSVVTRPSGSWSRLIKLLAFSTGATGLGAYDRGSVSSSACVFLGDERTGAGGEIVWRCGIAMGLGINGLLAAVRGNGCDGDF